MINDTFLFDHLMMMKITTKKRLTEDIENKKSLIGYNLMIVVGLFFLFTTSTEFQVVF